MQIPKSYEIIDSIGTNLIRIAIELEWVQELICDLRHELTWKEEKQKSKTEKKFVNLKEAREISHVSEKMLLKYIKSGELASHQEGYGRIHQIDIDDLKPFIRGPF